MVDGPINKEDREFFRTIDERLHHLQPVDNRFIPDAKMHTFTDEKMTLEEANKLVKILNRTGLKVTPGSQFGFSIEFYLSDHKRLLTAFKEYQLPEGHNFETLTPYFSKPTTRSQLDY